jgi:UDP-glucose 4-epimerase
VGDDRRVAVIGGASLVGMHILELLQEERPDWYLSIYDNFRTGDELTLRALAASGRCSVESLDVRDAGALATALKGCETVFHLAAMLSMSFPRHTREAIEVNVLGSLNVIEACVNSGARLILSSSAGGVYGVPEAGDVREDSPLRHASLPPGTAMYGAGKILVESICRDRGTVNSSFSWTALRYTSVYGRRQHARGRHTAQLAENMRRLAAGDAARFDRPPEESHDYIDARDVARCNLVAAEASSDVLNRAYNVSSGRATSNEEIASLLARVTGSDVPPKWVSSNGPMRPLVVYDPGAARDALGWAARIDLEDGLKDLYASLQEGAI